MRFAFLFAPIPLIIAGACSLESGGLTGDAGVESGLEDRGSGMTDSGGACACVPNPGMGFTFVAYQRDGSDACSGDFGTQKFAVEETMTGPAVCACTCAMAPTMDSTCTLTGTYNLDLFTNPNCGGSPNRTLSNVPAACFDVNGDYNQNQQQISGKSTVPTITVTGGTCAAPTANSTTVPTDLHKGQSCTLTGALGSGCMNAMDACVPATPNNFGLCVSSTQANATCPNGFPNKHRVGVGKSDSRTCSTCSCAPDPICAAGGRFNDANDCSGTDEGVSFLIDGQCHTVDQATNFDGHSLFSRANVITQRCSAKGGMPTGSVSLDSEYTVCCP